MQNFIKILTYHKIRIWNILSYPLSSHLQFHLFLKVCQRLPDIYTSFKMRSQQVNNWTPAFVGGESVWETLSQFVRMTGGATSSFSQTCGSVPRTCSAFHRKTKLPQRRESPQDKTVISNQIGIKWNLGILCLLAFSFTACDPGWEEHSSPSEAPESVLQMDPEERALVVTNDLFEAIINNQSQETIENILLTTNNDLSSKNKKGDTGLGTAIQFRRKELALFLLEKSQCEDLYHQNNEGKSYVYLSAQYGYHELIQLIANKCYERKKTWTTLYDYEFSDLDPETLDGERAIHVAYNSAVMDALHTEYWRGMYEFPWRAFYKTNNKEETFLHTAVKDGRNSVVEWGVQIFCHENSWEKSDHLYQKIPAAILSHTWHGIQTYLQTVTDWSFFHMTQLINFQDEEDNTALHRASQRPLNLEAIRLISNCRWTDYNIDNSLGNNALQEFLKGLDHTLPNHEKEIKETFMFLIHQETYLKQLFTRTAITKRVNHQNSEGDSSLHRAAELADEFFYNELKKFGDIYLPNKKDQTPKAIFESTQSQLQEKKQP